MEDENTRRNLAMLGQGLARQAGEQINQVPDYRQYFTDAQTMGVQPLPISDPNWVKHYQQLLQPKQQQPQTQMPQGLLVQ